MGQARPSTASSVAGTLLRSARRPRHLMKTADWCGESLATSTARADRTSNEPHLGSVARAQGKLRDFGSCDAMVGMAERGITCIVRHLRAAFHLFGDATDMGMGRHRGECMRKRHAVQHRCDVTFLAIQQRSTTSKPAPQSNKACCPQRFSPHDQKVHRLF